VSATSARLGPRWAHWYRRALPAYWFFLFCLTHFPKLEIGLDVPKSDKLAHLGAFGILAFLFWRFAESIQGPVSTRFVYLAAIVLCAYGAADEWLQQFVGRSTDFTDWLCDAAGIVVVLALLEWRRRRSHRAARVVTA
jgi:VanZ family protein